MKIPSHIVIDTADGFVFARDRYGNLFDEQNANLFAEARNEGQRAERRTYVVAVVTPVMSPELMAAVVRDNLETLPQIES